MSAAMTTSGGDRELVASPTSIPAPTRKDRSKLPTLAEFSRGRMVVPGSRITRHLKFVATASIFFKIARANRQAKPPCPSGDWPAVFATAKFK